MHRCDVQEQMAAVRAVAEPLRVRLNIPPMQQHMSQLRSAQQLPQPLHTAFLQLRAVQEAYELPADISISGGCKACDACATNAGGKTVACARWEKIKSF